MTRLLAAILLTILVASAALPQEPPVMSISQIKPGLFLVDGGGGSTTVLVTPDGLVVVDTKNPGAQFYDSLMALVRTVSAQQVKFVFVTHVHQDHSGNIERFIQDGVQVIAHENVKTYLPGYTSPEGKPASPNITYTGDYTIRLGGADVQVYHYGPGHTSGDSIVYYPDLRVIQTGDVVRWKSNAAGIDFSLGGSVLGAQRVLDEIAKLDFDTLIPGHAGPMTRAEFDEYKAKFDTVITRAREAVKAGVSREALITAIKTDDLEFDLFSARYHEAGRIEPFYDELAGR